MSAETSFRFGDGYELRPVTDGDLELAERWTNADPDHRERVHPEFWKEQGIGIDSYLLLRHGQPVYFFRMEQAVRVHIQFGPSETADEQRANREAMQDGLKWLQAGLGMGQTREILFDSTSRLLRRFCTGLLGFDPKPDTLSAEVHRLPPGLPGPAKKHPGLG